MLFLAVSVFSAHHEFSVDVRNKLANLDGFGAKNASLEHIDLSDNVLQSLDEISKLSTLPKLASLALGGNVGLVESVQEPGTMRTEVRRTVVCSSNYVSSNLPIWA